MKSRPNLPIPLLAAVFGCLAGIVWQEYSTIQNPFVLLLLFFASLPLAVHAYKLRNKKQLRTVTVFLCMLGSACVYQFPQYAFIKITEKYAGQPITLHGTIQEMREENREKIITLGEITIETSQGSEKPAWFTKAIVRTASDCAATISGSMHLKNIYIKLPEGTIRKYHLKEHLLGFYFPKKEMVSVTQPPENALTWVEKQKTRLNCAISDVFSPATQNMVKSVFLGQSQALTSEIRSLFERWGISHYLARSGLHLVLLASVMILILQALMLPVFVTRGATLALSILYHLMTAPSTSFMRAFMMNMMIGASLFLGTTPTILHLFSIVTLITILTNPFTPLNLDFQLSFGISGALIFMFNIVQKIENNHH